MAAKKTTAREAARIRKGGFTAAESAKLKKELSKGRSLDRPVRSKAGASTVAAVAKRFGITAREARDIATAVAKGSKYETVKSIKETVKAATTGQKGYPVPHNNKRGIAVDNNPTTRRGKKPLPNAGL